MKYKNRRSYLEKHYWRKEQIKDIFKIKNKQSKKSNKVLKTKKYPKNVKINFKTIKTKTIETTGATSESSEIC